MSNPLSVRRVMVQTIDENGNPEGKPTFGVMAADSYTQSYNDTFETLEALNAAIQEEGCILDIVNSDGAFDSANREKIGTDNYYGKDWETEVFDVEEPAVVRCIINNDSPGLTVGKVYAVIGKQEDEYKIMDDEEDITWYNAKLFEPATTDDLEELPG